MNSILSAVVTASLDKGVEAKEINLEYRVGSLKKVEKNFFFVIPFTKEVVSQPDKACNMSKLIGSIFKRRIMSCPIALVLIMVIFFVRVSTILMKM